MRKAKFFISGILAFWLWLFGEHPRTHAYDIVGSNISGTVDADATLNDVLDVNPSLTVNPGVTLTLKARLQAAVPATNILTNNGTILSIAGNYTNLNIVNNGYFWNGTSTTGAHVSVGQNNADPTVFTNNSGATLTNVKGIWEVRDSAIMNNYGRVTNNSNFDVSGTMNNYSGGIIINNQSAYSFSVSGTLNNYSGGAISNNGSLYLYNTLNNSGTLTNNNGATITNQSVVGFNNQAGGLLVNNGTLNITTPNHTLGIAAVLNNYGTLENNGLIANNGSQLMSGVNQSILNNYGTLTNKAGATVDNYGFFNNGTLANNANAILNNFGTFNINLQTGTSGVRGWFTNYGTINNFGTFTGNLFISYGTVTNNGTFASVDNYGTFNNTGVIAAITSDKILFNSGTINFWQNGLEANVGGVYTPTTAEMTNSGTTGAFSNYGKMTNTASGVITIPVGNQADLRSGELINNGRFTNNGTLNNHNDGTTDDAPGWPLRAATFTNNGSLTNNNGASFQNMGGAIFTNNGVFYNYGAMSNKELTVWNTHRGTVTNNGVIYNYGTMTNRDGSSFTSSGSIYNYGAFTNAAGSILNITGGTVYGPIVNNGTFNVSGGSFILPSAGQSLSITNLSGSAAFHVAGITTGYPPVIVTATAVGSHTLDVSGISSVSGAIKAVDLPAGSNATFSGGGDVGAYYSTLNRGSSIGLDSEDYYLVSSGQPSSLTKAAMGQTVGAMTLWYGEMNEIRKRMGELRIGKQSADDFWARVYGSRFTVRPEGADGFDQKMHGMEIGKDNPQRFAGGKRYTGFLIGYGKADNTFDSGSYGTTESVYLGAYASWMKNDGTYFDLIGKYNRFNVRFATANDRGSYYSNGLGLSAEIGKRFERGKGFFVEPAAELSAMWGSNASYTTANGLTVELPASTSLQLRLGLTAGRKWQGAGGTSRQFYGKVSWVKEFNGDSTTRVDGAAFNSSLKGHQWVAGAGFILDSANHQIFLDVEKSWGSAVSKDWGLNFGCRWKY